MQFDIYRSTEAVELVVYATVAPKVLPQEYMRTAAQPVHVHAQPLPSQYGSLVEAPLEAPPAYEEEQKQPAAAGVGFMPQPLQPSAPPLQGQFEDQGILCQNCKALNVADARFCCKCGTSLVG